MRLSLGGQDYVDRSLAFVREVNGFQVEFAGSNTTSPFGRLRQGEPDFLNMPRIKNDHFQE